MRAFLKNKSGQRAQAWANLDHVIIRSNLRLIDNPPGQVLIVQEILSEGLGRRYADFFKRRADLGKLHRNFAERTGNSPTCSQNRVNKIRR